MREWTPGWEKGLTNAQGYCSLGLHFVESGMPIWKFWATPLLGVKMVCAACAASHS